MFRIRAVGSFGVGRPHSLSKLPPQLLPRPLFLLSPCHPLKPSLLEWPRCLPGVLRLGGGCVQPYMYSASVEVPTAWAPSPRWFLHFLPSTYLVRSLGDHVLLRLQPPCSAIPAAFVLSSLHFYRSLSHECFAHCLGSRFVRPPFDVC